MKISDLTVEVRSSTLARVGQILPADLIGLELALRFNKVGSWKLKLRSDHPMVDSLRAAGGGIIVTGSNGVILSGPTVSATNVKTADDPTGYWEIIGTDDSVVLGERLAYPVPSTADLSLQTSAYDTRTGKAETVVKAYVNANIGPSAPAARKISTLTIDTDLARGNTVTGTARFDTLGALCEQLLATSQLGFDIAQNGSSLTFYVYQPTDRTLSVRMDVDNLRLTKAQYSYAAPQATRVIVAGQGEGSARTLIERTSTASTTAETAWGRRIEVFKDQRNTNVTAELQQAGDEILIDKGKTIEGISVTPSDDQTMQFGVDWNLGDKVSVVVNDSEIAQIVTEIAIVVTDEGIKIGATVGDPSTASSDTDTQLIGASTEQEARISALERNDVTTIADGAITTEKLADDAVTSAKIVDGTIVNADINASAAIAPSKIAGTAVITTDSRLSDARTPTGAAGGALAGTYPNPTLAIPAGLHPMIPSSVSVGTGSASVAADGTVTFTNVDYVQLNDVFTTAYRNYLLVFERTAGTAQESMHFQLVDGTTPSTAAVYDTIRIYTALTATTPAAVQTLAGTSFQTTVTNATAANYQYVTCEISAPKLARPTGAKWTALQWTTAAGLASSTGMGYHRNSTAFEGIRIKYDNLATSTHTGTAKVYGYN